MLFCVLLFVLFAHKGAANGLDPLGNFCRRWYHQSQIKNGILFIDGGIESFSDRFKYQYGLQPNWTGPITTGPNNYVIAINMSTSWDWKLNISEVAINKTVDSETGNPPPRVQNAALFQGPVNDPQIYLYGGVTPSINQSFPTWQWPTTNQYTLWGFNTLTHAWTQYDIFAQVPERPSQGASTEVPDLGLAFYMNGVITNMSSPTTDSLGNTTVFLEGMVVVDLNNQTASNISTSAITNDHPQVRGGLIYVPNIASSGILVQIGGATETLGSLSLISMEQINIFDVSKITSPSSTSGAAEDGWSSQVITGTVPEPRVDFCLVLASAPDNSSLNIYMYGGWDPTQINTYFDEVWVLSLPSFTWIKIYNGTAPRFGHTCHAVGNRQMITIGGLDNKNATDYCDWEYMSVAIYDLTEGETVGWGSVFSADKPPYQVNSQIIAAVGGGPDGNATKLLPEGGWSSAVTAKLFTGTNNESAPANINWVSKESSPASTTNQVDKALVAGGTVGGIVALALVAASLYFFVRLVSFKKMVSRDRGQIPFSKPELAAGGDEASGEITERKTIESAIHRVVPEADGNARSELVAQRPPAELNALEFHEVA